MHWKQTLLWRFSLAIAITILIASTGAAFAQSDSQLPSRLNYVSDYAQILDDQAESDMNKMLDQVKKEMGVEIDILTVLTTDPVAINEYGRKISDAWKLGEDDAKRKTLLFVVAVNDGLYRLITNKGLETVLTDDQLKKISAGAIQPAFEQGQYAKGIASGVSQIIQILSNKGGGSQIPGSSGQGFAAEDMLVILLGIVAAAVVLLIVFLLLKR